MGLSGQKTADNPNGQEIRLSFDNESYKARTFGDLIGHEGSHIADGSDWVKSGFSDSKNPTKYQTEFDAYTVQGLLAQAENAHGWSFIPTHLIKGFPTVYIPIWNSGWEKADIESMRGKNIDLILSA